MESMMKEAFVDAGVQRTEKEDLNLLSRLRRNEAELQSTHKLT